jgi:hypothetical protein
MKADEFRRLAAECLRLAQLAKERADKLLLLQMAESYRQIAERSECEK